MPVICAFFPRLFYTKDRLQAAMCYYINIIIGGEGMTQRMRKLDLCVCVA